MQILKSVEDASVNYVQEALEGFIEARYVRKCPEYFICYLSSQTACNRGCRFCHLTATKQTRNVQDVTRSEFRQQAIEVLNHFAGTTPAEQQATRYMHFNFMARGEPLCNQYLLRYADEVLMTLGQEVTHRIPHIGVRHNISTIMPQLFQNHELENVFKIVHPTIYYSMYSVNEDFRRKWLPGAMPVREALSKLRRWQVFSKKLVKIHHCFIEGENDSVRDVQAVCRLIKLHDLRVEFNLVRYNPFSPEQGRESSGEVIARNMQLMSKLLGVPCKIIPRVGRDVHASCGMFVDKEGNV